MISRATILALLLPPLMTGCGSQQITNVLLDIDSSLGVNQTGAFDVSGKWDLQYNWDCSTQAAQHAVGIDKVTIDVYNADDGSTAFENPQTVSNGRIGSRTLHFTRGGYYYIGVTTRCTWRIQAIVPNST